MRVWTDDVPVHQRRPLAAAAMRHRCLHRCITLDRIGPIDFREKEVGEIGDQLRDIAARRIHFDRRGDRIAVVFHDKEYWQLAVRG